MFEDIIDNDVETAKIKIRKNRFTRDGLKAVAANVDVIKAFDKLPAWKHEIKGICKELRDCYDFIKELELDS